MTPKLKETYLPFPTGIHVELYEEKDRAAKLKVHSIVTNPFNCVQVNVKEQISKFHHNKLIIRRASQHITNVKEKKNILSLDFIICTNTNTQILEETKLSA